MRRHVGKLSSICFFNLRNRRQFRWMLDPSSRQRLVSAFILSRIAMPCLPACQLACLHLQRVMNATARFVAGPPACAHISVIMWSLHLGTSRAYRIRYKLCFMSITALVHPTSQTKLLEFWRFLVAAGSDLRTPASSTYLAPEQNSEREFSLWHAHENGMLCRSRSETSSAFKRAIKTHFFNMAYSDT